MESGITHNRTGGESFHIKDCYVWWTIHYLDSNTDYREHLPCCDNSASSGIAHDLVMLDSSGSPLCSYLWSILKTVLAIALTLTIVYMVVVR